MTYGWNKFKQDPGTWILLILVALIGTAVVEIVTVIIRASISGGFFSFLLISALSNFLIFVVSITLQMPLYRAALGAVSGVRPTTDLLTNFDQFGPFFLTELIVGALVFVGTLLCFLPGVAVGFLTFFAPFFVLSRQEQPVDAIKSSYSLVTTNLGPMLLFALVGFLLYVLGLVACLVGVLVTGPIVLIAAAYAFKTAQGEPVAP